MVDEIRNGIAIAWRERSYWHPPRRWIRLASHNICRNCCAIEGPWNIGEFAGHEAVHEPCVLTDGDTIGVPFHRENSTALGVEARTPKSVMADIFGKQGGKKNHTLYFIFFYKTIELTPKQTCVADFAYKT